jgi:hypothetical protein
MATSKSKARPTPEQFIAAWQSSSSVRAVADKLKMNTNQVRTRACRYRQRGIPLKEYSWPGPPDWTALAAYAMKLGPQDRPTVEPKASQREADGEPTGLNEATERRTEGHEVEMGGG